MSIGLDFCEASGWQKGFLSTGWALSRFARGLLRNVELLTRPNCLESKTKLAAFACLNLFLALPCSPIAFACRAASACGKGRFQVIKRTEDAPNPTGRLRMMSLNACLQDPWSPFTGGVVPPFECLRVHARTRIAALADFIAEENPDVFLGQEFESPGAQEEIIRMLKARGYRHFIRDLGAHVINPSGLFVASKYPLNNISFKAYPLADRAGLARGSQQGALAFTVGEVSFVNVHLNYGDGKNNPAARNQLQKYVLPFLQREGKVVVCGDLNCEVERVGDYRNVLYGQVTCSDEGKHLLRGKKREGCRDCAESIDGLIHGPEVIISDVAVKKVFPLSDHYAVIATVS